MIKKYSIFILITILTIQFCFADSNTKNNIDYKIDIFNPLKQTPSALIIDNLSKPSTFHKNNNLT
jgi:hypothetical protein